MSKPEIYWTADQITRRKVSELTPYARNARLHSPAQVAQIAASIKEWGWTQPVIIDDENGILAGHGRVLAAQHLGLEEAPCIVATGWSEAQKRAYIIADNRLSELAVWDIKMLSTEVEDLKALGYTIDLTGFSEADLAEFLDNSPESAESNKESTKENGIDAPIYEPKNEKPAITELLDDAKAKQLRREIDSSGLPESIKDFLRRAADRHIAFKFLKIADYYAHSSAAVQDLMEKSGLVIIDNGQVIEHGFAALTEQLGKIATVEGWNHEG